MAGFPSLKGLQAFEAAARTGSFAAAASELSVSPAAISQLIRAVEDQVDRQLFHRVNRGVVLTEAGVEILPRLSAAFEELRGVSRHLSGSGPRSRLTVSVPQSVASGWLSVRIADFIAVHGAVDISVRGEDDPVPFDRELIDLRLSFGRFHYQANEGVEIITDAAHPVCAPEFLERHGPLLSPAELARVPLIHTDWGPAAATFPAWRSWFEEMSVSAGPNAERGMLANSSQVAVELAASGLGVALSQGLLAAGRIGSGALVRASDRSMMLSQPYVLTMPDRSAQRPVVQVFAAWLKREMLRSVGALIAVPRASTA